MRKMFFLALLVVFCQCGSSNDNTQPTDTAMYFPPIGSDTWQTTTPESLQWNTAALQPLLDYLETKHSKSFMILVDGKIVVEQYFNGQTATSPWYWASAGKTLTSTVTGIAAQQGFLDINDQVSDYLGTGWTSESPAQEARITNRHLLTMTSGLDDALGDNVSPANLQYKADAGTRWAYHNVYVKLQDVVAAATGQSWSSYFNAQLRDKIGMTGAWINSGDDLSVYWSTARSMARFGLLMLNHGEWNGQVVLNRAYFNTATTTSQDINLGYGFLWWLNGKSSYHLPQTQLTFQGSIIPSAPNDMFMALGKNDQKIYIVPSKKMVVIRMGEAADNVNLALSDFDEVLWEKISAFVGN